MCVAWLFYFSIRARGRDVAVGPGGRRLRIGEGVVGSGPSVVVGRTPYANQGPHVHITSLQNVLHTHTYTYGVRPVCVCACILLYTQHSHSTIL